MEDTAWQNVILVIFASYDVGFANILILHVQLTPLICTA